MSETRRTGTQSLERAALLLREIATRGRFGWRLKDLAERCQLDRATTYRLLQGLVRERLIRQRDSDRHYLPGPLLFELGLSVPDHSEFQAACRAPLTRLSKRFASLSAAFLRSGAEFVCAGRAGQSVYVGTVLEVGTRRPLITTAGGVAILIAMPPEESRQLAAQNLKQLSVMGPAVTRRLESFLRRSEGLGYAYNRSETTAGVHSFGVPIRDAGQRVFASIVVSGHAEEFPAERVPEVVAALRDEAGKLEREVRRIELQAA